MPRHDQTASNPASSLATSLAQPVLEALEHAVDKVRYGVIQLTVHEGKVVQLDVTERRRF